MIILPNKKALADQKRMASGTPSLHTYVQSMRKPVLQLPAGLLRPKAATAGAFMPVNISVHGWRSSSAATLAI